MINQSAIDNIIAKVSPHRSVIRIYKHISTIEIIMVPELDGTDRVTLPLTPENDIAPGKQYFAWSPY